MRTKWWTPWLYLAPALGALVFYLFYPMLRSIYISFFDKFSENFVGWDNYAFVFGQTMQKTLFNNFLWLTVFVGLVIFLGLLIAILLDRVKYEKYAKAIIFLPMGVSAVGAGIIWKFVYAYQPAGREQIGLMNAIATSLGDWAGQPFVFQILTFLSYGLWVLMITYFVLFLRDQFQENESKFPRYLLISMVVFKITLFLQTFGHIGFLSWLTDLMLPLLQWAADPAVSPYIFHLSWISGVCVVLFFMLSMIQFASKYAVPFIGIFALLMLDLFLMFNASTPPVAWVIDRSINNFSLIAVGVWIWTGFAMVFLSANYKGLPKELTEAATIDGANEWQVFWRIHMPLLRTPLTTITVTMVVFSLKIFDEVYVMTAGNYDTQVLANRMVQEIFAFSNNGHASAISVVLLIAIIPAIIFNLWSYHKRGVF